MMDLALTFQVNCPVCATQAVNLIDHNCCVVCGWQFEFYSGTPEKNQLEKLLARQQVKQTVYKNYQQLEKNNLEYKEKIAILENMHKDHKDNYEKLLPDYQNFSSLFLDHQQEETIEENDLMALEQNIITFQEKINTYSSRISSFDPANPVAHFEVVYNRQYNEIEAEVIQVFRPFPRISQDLVFAVAFFVKERESFLEADLIIPTEPGNIKTCKVGDKFRFKLKFKPPHKLLNSGIYQIIHLIHNSIKEIRIDHAK